MQVRSRLASAQIDPFDLSLINQNDCPRDLADGYNININDETISAKAAAGVIRKAGEKIGMSRVSFHGKLVEFDEHFPQVMAWSILQGKRRKSTKKWRINQKILLHEFEPKLVKLLIQMQSGCHKTETLLWLFSPLANIFYIVLICTYC